MGTFQSFGASTVPINKENTTIAGFNKKDNRREPAPMINERILRHRDIRVIGSDGSQIGILQSRNALKQARDEGLDLVMVSPTAVPPVCKIMDYGRHKYEQSKLDKERKKPEQETKEVKVSSRIADHDLQTMTKRAGEFLKQGHRVKVSCLFRSREIAHPHLGAQKMEIMSTELAEVCVVERAPTLEGKIMSMMLVPKKA